MDDQLKQFVKKRATIKAKVTLYEKYIETTRKISPENFDKVLLGELQLKLTRFQELLSQFDEIQSQIEDIADDKIEEQLLERENIEDRMIKLISLSQSILEANQLPTDSKYASPATSQAGGSAVASNIAQQQNCHIKLPTLRLPTFDGSYSKWMEFRDTFNSLINNNESIPAINKFHYLRASLEGGAAVVIKSIEFTNANYQVAWDLLCERYNSEKILINNHIKSMFTMEPIIRESHKSLRYMIDFFSKNLRALHTLKEPTDSWDTLIIYLMVSKLDGATSRKWEEHKNTLATSPKLDDFLIFLRNRADVLETIQCTASTQKQQFYNAKEHKHVKTFLSSTSDNKYTKPMITCAFCKQNHFNHECAKFKELSVDCRQSEVSKHNLCKNCLRPGHHHSRCRLGPCKTCNKKHNTLLHNEAINDNNTDTNIPENNNVAAMSTTLSTSVPSQVLLCTAEVELVDTVTKQSQSAKILLDVGSQSSFISKNMQKKLNLTCTETSPISISGINNSLSKTTERCDVLVKSRTGSFEITVSCLVVPEITGLMPSVEVDTSRFNLPVSIELADPSFYNPSEIHVLLGADVFWDVVGSKQIKLGQNKPTLQDSRLGWLVSGPTGQQASSTTRCNFSREIKESLSQFWELENIPTVPYEQKLTKEQEQCEAHFINNTVRLDDGRFCVKLPLREVPEEALGDSYNIAKRRFYNLEKKLNKQSNMKKDYTEFLKEYESLGHLTEIDRPSFGYYIPHHAVIRENRETTRLRVVFDASCVTSTSKSLNDILMVGPVVQDDLLSILLRFRQNTYVVTGDIEKMYRQVRVDDSQCHLQLILWRDDDTQPLKTLKLQTLTYGTASAAHLSTRCLVQLADECTDEAVANAIRHDFYVDDLNTGSDSKTDLASTVKGVIDKLAEAGFPLRKFRTNATDIFDNIDTTHQTQDFCKQSTVLGLNWSPPNDKLQFSSEFEQIEKVTKRNILSNSCKIFDPLGLLSACTIFHKIVLQKLWLTKLDWDDPVPKEIETSWREFIQDSQHFANLHVPRHALCDKPTSIEVHTFTDASIHAYAACLYLKSVDSQGKISVHLLCAKAKVTPLKPEMTVPRVELLGALLGARLHVKVTQALRVPIKKSIFWTDSTIVLGWLQTQPKTLKTFVCNRVDQIRELSDPNDWRHIPTDFNPADLATRGVKPRHIIDNTLWWEGPCFLKKPETEWPSANPNNNVTLPEIKSFTAIQTCEQSVAPFHKFSRLQTLQRVFAFALRFLNNCTNKNTKLSGALSTSELQESLTMLAIISQKESFSQDIHALKTNNGLNRKSKLLDLNPFFDDKDILRVGGRIVNATHCSYDQRHPILIDSKHVFTRLLFEREHLRLLHGGPQLLLNSVRERFWPIGGRTLAASVVSKCMRCQRFRVNAIQPVMGNLPAPRVTPALPFANCGTDFAGPFLISNKKGRGAKTSKCYLCVFVCFSTKAVHLEVVSDLTANAFIMCMRRFIARRGKPNNIYCDNGKNYVGAKNELNRLFQTCKRQIGEFACGEEFVFHFIPAYAPNFGGIWEAAVKSAKYHLKRIAGNTSLTFEELATLFAQIEAIMNSRPLTPLSANPSDLAPLTPGHFLVGRALMSVPSPVVQTVTVNRYQLIQRLKQNFWTRWSKDYLCTLQQRLKWKTNKKEIEIDDMVLIMDDQLPPMKWLLGRIVRLYPGEDGICRVVDLKTKNGIIRRAVSKLSALEGLDSKDEA